MTKIVDTGQNPDVVYTLNRRALMGGLGALVGAGGAATAAAAVAPEELPVDAIDRLFEELADALAHYDSGKWRAIIEPDGVSWLNPRARRISVGPKPSDQDAIGRRLFEMAEEMSELLTVFYDGAWFMRVQPIFQDKPLYSLQPADVVAHADLAQGLAIAAAALNAINPGCWCTEVAMNKSFALIINDTHAHKVARRAANDQADEVAS